MNIAAITRFKHGNMYRLLKNLGWSQTDLARKSGVTHTVIGSIINLQRRPSEEVANKIQAAFAEAGEYIDVTAEWPESFKGIKRGFRSESFAEVQPESMIDHPEVLQIADSNSGSEEEDELIGRLKSAIELLPGIQRIYIRQFYLEGKTAREIAESRNVTVGSVHAAMASGVNKLRSSMHRIFPSRSREECKEFLKSVTLALPSPALSLPEDSASGTGG